VRVVLRMTCYLQESKVLMYSGTLGNIGWVYFDVGCCEVMRTQGPL
jgi:hypothetical protein